MDKSNSKPLIIILVLGLAFLFVIMFFLSRLDPSVLFAPQPTPVTPRITPTPFDNDRTPDERLAAAYVDTIGGWTCENDGFGSVTISGRVENDHPTKTLESVRLRGRIELDGRVINTTTSLLDSDQLEPGATSSYDIFIDNPDDEDVRCFVSVESARFED